MAVKIVVFNVNKEELEEKGLDFENEMYWLRDSNIHCIKILDIPEELILKVCSD